MFEDTGLSVMKSEKDDETAEFDVKTLSPGFPSWSNYVKVEKYVRSQETL